MARRTPTDDFDSPWKDALQRYLRQFLEFFFAAIAADIDWQRGYEGLVKEFQQIVRRAKVGKGLAGKLFKVWLRDGSEHWLLIHVEVQGAVEEAFAERMFRYNLAAYALYNREAHTQALATRVDPPTRLQWKLRVVKGLYHRGWSADDIRELFRLVDWIMDLPEDLEEAFSADMFQFAEEKRMLDEVREHQPRVPRARNGHT